MGTALRSKGRLDEAVAAHRRALQIQPDSSDTHFNLANALLDLNRPQEAAEHFRLAGRAAPATASVENNLGIALAAEGKMAEAADAVPPRDRARARIGAGASESRATRWPRSDGWTRAIEHLRRATELEPANAGFRLRPGGRAARSPTGAEAIDEFRAALTMSPTWPPPHNNLGVALGIAGTSGRGDRTLPAGARRFSPTTPTRDGTSNWRWRPKRRLRGR